MDLFRRLRQRGYSFATLKPLFLAALMRSEAKNKDQGKKKLLFLYLPFHPANPPASTWRKQFQETVGHPPGSRPLSQLQGRLGYRKTFGDLGFTTNTNTAVGLIRPQSMHCYAVKKISMQLFAILDCELNALPILALLLGKIVCLFYLFLFSCS